MPAPVIPFQSEATGFVVIYLAIFTLISVLLLVCVGSEYIGEAGQHNYWCGGSGSKTTHVLHMTSSTSY